MNRFLQIVVVAYVLWELATAFRMKDTTTGLVWTLYGLDFDLRNQAIWRIVDAHPFVRGTGNLALLILIFNNRTRIRSLYRAARERLWPSPKPGHCRNCGYDLRATPTRCPECGTIHTPP